MKFSLIYICSELSPLCMTPICSKNCLNLCEHHLYQLENDVPVNLFPLFLHGFLKLCNRSNARGILPSLLLDNLLSILHWVETRRRRGPGQALDAQLSELFPGDNGCKAWSIVIHQNTLHKFLHLFLNYQNNMFTVSFFL
jgi:hypothetical protein